MKVIGVEQYGGPEALRVIERPEPQLTAGEVRFRVEFAGVNPVDAMVRSGELAGWFGEIDPPFVPGMDVVGVIDAIGDGTDSSWAAGDRAVAIVDNLGAYGAYSQLVVVPAASLIAPPAGATLPEAGSFLMNAMTAQCAVDALPAIDAAGRVLVTGAAGAVGANAIALAAASGHTVVALAGDDDRALLDRLGAAEIVSSIDDVAAPLAAVIDTAGIATAVVDKVIDGGTVVVVQPDGPNFDRGIIVTHVNVRDRLTDTGALAHLGRLAAAGVLPLRVADVIPARDASRAHQELARRGNRGRYVLDFRAVGDDREPTATSTAAG